MYLPRVAGAVASWDMGDVSAPILVSQSALYGTGTKAPYPGDNGAGACGDGDGDLLRGEHEVSLGGDPDA